MAIQYLSYNTCELLVSEVIMTLKSHFSFHKNHQDLLHASLMLLVKHPSGSHENCRGKLY